MATHAVRHTDYSLETHSFFSHHLGDTLLSLFVIYSRHTTSSLHGDTRRLIRHTDPSRHTGNCCSFFPIRHTDPSRHTGNSLFIHGDTRRLIRPTDPSRHTGNSFALATNAFSCSLSLTATHASSATHAGIGNTRRNSLVNCHRQHMPEFFLVVVACL